MTHLLHTQRARLRVLADDWLACGARSFSVWSAGQSLAAWPCDAVLDAPDLTADIRVGCRAVGQLHLSGLADAVAQGRLRAEAELLAEVLRLENDLQLMTAELIETQDQLLAMYDLTQATRSYLGMVETLHRLAQESARLMKAEGAIILLEPTLSQYPIGCADEHALLPFLLHAQESKRELVLDVATDVLPDGFNNLCVLPISIRGRQAALGLFNREDSLASPDLKLARAIADHAGAQLEHTLLYQETLDQARFHVEMDIARKVQLQMLPQRPPRVAGLEVFAQSRPALQVGGDFYDFIAEPDRPLMLLLGDVAGKGISAAMIMGMIHAVTRSAARFMPKVSPALLVSRTNNDLYDELTTLESFATAFVAQYEPATRTLHYANAGHAPVIYRPPDGPARLVESDGVPIGVLPISLSENAAFDLGVGALVVVTTDGFNEAVDPSNQLFGYERLLALVDEFADQPSQVMAGALYDAVEIYAAGLPQADDQTLIIIKGVPA